LVAVPAVILVILILPPTLYLIVTSFFTTRPDGSFDQFTFRFYTQLVSSPFFVSSLKNTAIYAAGSAFVAIVLGVIQALIVDPSLKIRQLPLCTSSAERVVEPGEYVEIDVAGDSLFAAAMVE
jgi:ABC-type spermidine/putrescine transport system permease subunit II